MPEYVGAFSKDVGAMRAAVFQSDTAQVLPFLGACNEYRGFIEDFSNIARPFNGYLKQSKEFDRSNLTTEALNTLNTLKFNLVQPSVLSLPQPLRPYMVASNASACALEAVPLQQ